MPGIRPFQLRFLSATLKRTWPAAQNFSRGLLSLALPLRCLRLRRRLPRQVEISLCRRCVQAIAPELGECCLRCGAVLPENSVPAENCPACKEFSLKFDAVYPLGR